MASVGAADSHGEHPHQVVVAGGADENDICISGSDRGPSRTRPLRSARTVRSSITFRSGVCIWMVTVAPGVKPSPSTHTNWSGTTHRRSPPIATAAPSVFGVRTVTWNVLLDELPAPSVAVHVTCVRPLGITDIGAGLQIDGNDPSTVSAAAGGE